MAILIVVDEVVCVGCSYCKMICPYDAIEVEGLSKIDQEACVGCLKCLKNCPVSAISLQ
ncbi:MAG: 4Fe-4S binding protein [Candidatus Odinarchaeota archaeon]